MLPNTCQHVLSEKTFHQAYLVAMQTAHPTLDFGGTDVADSVSLLLLDKNTSKQANEVRRMEKNVWFFKRHYIIDASRQMISPHPVLSAHMLFFIVLAFLAP